MARQDVNVADIDTQGITNPSYTVIGTDGIAFKNDGRVLAHVVAPSAATLTIATPATVNGDLQIDDRTFSLAIDDELLIGKFDIKYYNNADGEVLVDSDVNDTEIFVFKA